MNSGRRTDPLHTRVQQLLRFNLFYAQRLRDADAAYENWEGGSAERRMLQELEWPRTPGWLSWRLNLDRGYISRTLKTMEAYRYVTILPEGRDRRQRVVQLTAWGRQVLENLRRGRESTARQTLEGLPQGQQRRLVRAMALIEEVLTHDPLSPSGTGSN